MNGLDGSSGGPTFSGTQQGVSGDWWVWGYLPGQSPDGTLNADGSLNAAQEAVWSQTLFKPVTTTPTPTPVPTPAPTPTPTPSTTASPSNTQVFAGSTAAIIDSSGNRWTITSGAQIAVNGTVDTTTANVIEIAYEQGVIWQENQSDLWWSKTSPSAAWAPPAGTSVSPIPATPTPTPAPTPAPTPGPTPTVTTSANDTQVAIGSTSAIIDSAGNQWTITSGGQIAVNGTVDATTGRVILLAYENSVIWQENADDLWWSKTSVSATWLPAGGTAVSPIPASDLAAVATITITPTNGTTQTISGNAVTTKTVASDTFTLTGNGAASIVLGSTSQTINFIQMSNVTVTGGAGSATLTASAGTYSITVGKGAMQVTAGAGVDSYVVKRGSGALTINDFSTAQGDTLTVASALQNAAKVASDGQGGSAITFGGAAGAVDLKGVSSFSLSTIHWA
jgi:hypothetical protein